MKRCIRSSTGYNVSWYTQDGRQSGAYVEVPNNVTDEYNYIERCLQDKYGDEYGGVADYISEYEGIDASFVTATTEKELDDAILNGRPFDIDTFRKYKVDPYRAEGALKAGEIQEGDIIEVTESAAEVDYGTQVQIIRIDTSDPDGYSFSNDPVITFEVWDGSSTFNMHFWPDEYVGPKIAEGPDYNISLPIQSNVNCSSAAEVAEPSMKWSDMWRPYAGSQSGFTTLYVDGQEVGYVESWESDGAYGYIAYLKSDPTEYEESVGEFRSLDAAKACLESIVQDTQDRVDSFPVTSSEAINSDSLEDDYEWSPFENHNYLVVAGPYSDVTFFCDDSKKAIAYWFKYQKKYPMDVSISCPTKELAVKLVKAGTSKYLTTLYDKYPDCPYKLDYLIEECKRKVTDGCRGFYENDYGYGDSVHPFTVG